MLVLKGALKQTQESWECFLCCPPKEHKLSSLEQHSFITSQFHQLGVQTWLRGVLCSGSHTAMIPISRFQRGLRLLWCVAPLSSSCGVGRIHFLTDVGLMAASLRPAGSTQRFTLSLTYTDLLLKGSPDSVRPTQDDLPFDEQLGTLITFAKSLHFSQNPTIFASFYGLKASDRDHPHSRGGDRTRAWVIGIPPTVDNYRWTCEYTS